jgi:hypothetical protein
MLNAALFDISSVVVIFNFWMPFLPAVLRTSGSADNREIPGVLDGSGVWTDGGSRSVLPLFSTASDWHTGGLVVFKIVRFTGSPLI